MALLQGYQLCAATEGKSRKTIEIVTCSVTYFAGLLAGHSLTADAELIGRAEIRAFILYLQQKKCFSGHPHNPPLEHGLPETKIEAKIAGIGLKKGRFFVGLMILPT